MDFNENTIKYKYTKFLNSEPLKLSELKESDFFFTTKKWSTKNNNYILFKDNYYIIEPGFYYYNFNCKLFINNDININKIKIIC